MSQITTPPLSESPPSRRLAASRARDPRLWIGLALVAVATVAGARVLAAADDTVGVWTLERDLAAGSPLAEDSLAVEQVRLSNAGGEAGYVLARESLPDDAVLGRDVRAGELLHRSAIESGETATARQLPVVVSAAGAPEDLRSGQVVDLWVAPGDTSTQASGTTAEATQVLADVTVVRAARDAGPWGDGSRRQVLLGIDEEDAGELAEIVAQVTAGEVVLVRHGGS